MSKHNIFKKTLIVRLFFISVFCITSLSSSAQTFDDLDSLLVDRDIENYSIRLFTNFKVNKFTVKDDDSKAKFVPNNRYGLGLGFANKKIIVDIAFNLKNPNKEKTRKFDLQATTILKNRHFVNIYAQTYKGFTSKNNFEDPKVFRKDIRSVSIGLNYLYTFDDIEFSYSLIKAGLHERDNQNVFITGGIGAFTGFNYFSGKPSILSETTRPYFNEQGDIKRYQGIAFGVLAGVVSIFKLPENITATVNLMPGIGLINKKITLQEESYIASNPMLYKFDFLIGLNYNLNQYYLSLTYSNGLYTTDLGYDNTYRLNLTKAKLAIGYKFKSKKKR